MPLRVLALDLERTLISDANSVDPRPHLAEFLAFCHEHFERITLFTTVEEPNAREALTELVRHGHVQEELVVASSSIARILPSASPEFPVTASESNHRIRAELLQIPYT